MGMSPNPKRPRVPAQPAPDPGGPAAVELHVEDLVLYGLAPGDRFAIAEALQRELARLITERGMPALARIPGIERIDGGAFRVEPGLDARGVGAQVAGAVYRGLAPEPRGSARSAETRSATRARHR